MMRRFSDTIFDLSVVTLKSVSEVTQSLWNQHRSIRHLDFLLKLIRARELLYVSTSTSIATMSLFRTVSETNGDFSRKWENWQCACAVSPFTGTVSGGCKIIMYLTSQTL